MMKLISVLFLLISVGCSSMKYDKAVPSVDLNRFMKRWYVIAGRVTFLEAGAHNAVEEYSFDPSENRININFFFNQDSFDGKRKTIKQIAWIVDGSNGAKWKVSPFWPLKFDYSVIAIDTNYSWVVIGVPNQSYLWVMSDKWNMDDATLKSILSTVEDSGYSISDVIRIPQKW